MPILHFSIRKLANSSKLRGRRVESVMPTYMSYIRRKGHRDWLGKRKCLEEDEWIATWYLSRWGRGTGSNGHAAGICECVADL